MQYSYTGVQLYLPTYSIPQGTRVLARILPGIEIPTVLYSTCTVPSTVQSSAGVCTVDTRQHPVFIQARERISPRVHCTGDSDSDSDSYGFIEFYNTMYGFQLRVLLNPPPLGVTLLC